MLDKINEAVSFIKSRISFTPQVGIVLGSGLGSFANEIEVVAAIPYGDIPHFPVSTVEGHSGKLILGKLSGKMVVAMAGRFHYYEGYAAQDIVFPIRVMKYLGIENLLLSNAAGGVNRDFKVGDIMLIRDHISQFTPNPLIGKNEPSFGPRFPDMSEAYSKALLKKAREIAAAKNISVKEGVYVSVTGPTFETRAEYQMIAVLGGDAVGMSTVQEVIVANHMKLPCFAISVITDVGIREEDNVITHEEELEAAQKAEPIFSTVFRELIRTL